MHEKKFWNHFVLNTQNEFLLWRRLWNFWTHFDHYFDQILTKTVKFLNSFWSSFLSNFDEDCEIFEPILIIISIIILTNILIIPLTQYFTIHLNFMKTQSHNTLDQMRFTFQSYIEQNKNKKFRNHFFLRSEKHEMMLQFNESFLIMEITQIFILCIIIYLGCIEISTT